MPTTAITESPRPNESPVADDKPFRCVRCGQGYKVEAWLRRHVCDPKKLPKPQRFKCEHCKRDFGKEATLVNHICEQKRRFLDRDEPVVKLAFQVYSRFYAYNYKHAKNIDYDHFQKSQIYTSFVKFARYLRDLNASRAMHFVDFLIKSELKLTDWSKPSVYEIYMREVAKAESADAALERNILLMESWANETGHDWQDFFRQIAPSLATQWIVSGKISPWVLLTTSSGHSLLEERLSVEQCELVMKAVDFAFWEQMRQSRADEFEEIRKILSSAGL